MDDKSALLNQLRIDRSDEPEPDGRGWLRWLILGLLVLAGIGIALLLFGKPSGIPVKVANARAVGGSGAAAGGSLLDAAG
jgi:hypothetical protein